MEQTVVAWHEGTSPDEPTVIDYRETAPAAATKDMFKKGDSHFSHRVVGVPGTVRGLALAHTRFGKLPWKNLVLPAAKLAEEGFVLDRHHAEALDSLIGIVHAGDGWNEASVPKMPAVKRHAVEVERDRSRQPIPDVVIMKRVVPAFVEKRARR